MCRQILINAPGAAQCVNSMEDVSKPNVHPTDSSPGAVKSLLAANQCNGRPMLDAVNLAKPVRPTTPAFNSNSELNSTTCMSSWPSPQLR
jgi:hypothetical protein